MPKVSVITTTYNSGRFLPYAIESILAQAYKDFEMVVVDDGSTDGTEGILANITDSRVKIFTAGRMGRQRALNFAVRKSIGEYVAILDADDVALPDRLDKQVRFLDNNEHVGLVGAAKKYFIDNAGQITGEDELKNQSNNSIKKALIKSNPIFHSSVMYRRNIFDKANGYDEGMTCMEDWDFYVRISPYCELVNIPEFLSCKRLHQEQFFDGKEGVHKSKKRNRARAIIAWRSVRYLNAPRRNMYLSFRYYLRSL